MKKHIYLIGFMGTGKSTISRRLNTVLKMEELDMDAFIVKENKMSINEMFEQFGEAYFREKETELLKRLDDMDPMIVSCGGGVAMRPENVEIMKQNGTIVLLTATPQTVYHRVRKGKERPLLKGNMRVSYIADLMRARRPAYEAAAEYSVKTDYRQPMDIAEEIAKLLGKA